MSEQLREELSDTPKSIGCYNCRRPYGSNDFYCGYCGKSLSSFIWKLDNSTEESQPRISLKITSREQKQVKLEFHNTGPREIVFRSTGRNNNLSEWLKTVDKNKENKELPDTEIRSGSKLSVELELEPDKIDEILHDKGQSNRSKLDTTLSFITSQVEVINDEIYYPRRVDIQLSLERKPWVSPSYIYFPFIAKHWIEQKKAVVVVEICNYTSEMITFDEIRFDDYAQDEENHITGIQLLGEYPLESFSLKPAENKLIKLPIQVNSQLLSSRELFVFATHVRIPYKYQTNQEAISFQLEGVIGDSPRLGFYYQKKSLPNNTLNINQVSSNNDSDVLEIRNEGSVPITIISIATDLEERSIEHRWLSFSKDIQGTEIPPKSSLLLPYKLSVMSRNSAEQNSRLLQTTIRIRHTGIPNENGLCEQQIPVLANLKALSVLEDVFMGIDFGTTNSTIGISSQDLYRFVSDVEPLSSKDNELKSDQLPSLVYIDEDDSKYGVRHYYGNDASTYGSAAAERMIRNLKTTCSKSIDLNFYLPSRGDFYRTTNYELTEKYITELVHRAHSSFQKLKLRDYNALNIDSPTEKNLRIKNAIFTHPVEISDNYKQALLDIAQKLDLYASRSPEEFWKNQCIDEASASLIAYILHLIDCPTQEEAQLIQNKPNLNLLCIDVGGGTTDIVAASIHNITTNNAADKVSLKIHSVVGDRLFGGNDIDILIVNLLLREIEKASVQKGFTFPAAIFEASTTLSSFDEFKKSYRSLFPSDSDYERNSERFFLASRNLLREAERIKKTFDPQDRVTLTLDKSDFSYSANYGSETTLEISLESTEIRSAIVSETTQKCILISQAVQGADWSWDDIDIVIFTGQSNRLKCLRNAFLGYIHDKRGSAISKELVTVDPDSYPDFDPKNCVALGAAVWGSNVSSAKWLDIQKLALEVLSFDLEIKFGLRWLPVDGLQKGQPLGDGIWSKEISFDTEQKYFVLYRNRRKYISFQFDWSKKIRIKVVKPDEMYLITETGQEYRGELA